MVGKRALVTLGLAVGTGGLAAMTSAQSFDLGDRLRGGWIGEMVGLNLGQPVELWLRPRIERELRGVGAWPLDDYFPGTFPVEPGLERWLRPSLTASWPNDDLAYLGIGLHTLERVGVDPSSADIADQWLLDLPDALACCTAELIAFRNLQSGLRPPASATPHNPYVEWIGAQMRAPVWGLVSPGMPARAAELARRDASISHTGVGIDGEVFVAALIAQAFLETQARPAVEVALRQLPGSSPYAAMVRQVLEIRDSGDDWEQAWTRLDAQFGFHGNGSRERALPPGFDDPALHPVRDLRVIHVIPNGAAVLLGLLWGRDDFSQAVTIAVMAGYDADNNGAVAGCAAGVLSGARAIPSRWKAPLNDTWYPDILTERGPRSIEGAAARLEVVARAALAVGGTETGEPEGGESCSLAGDVDGSCRVDGRDVAQVAIGFGSRRGEPRYTDAADIDDDGAIDGQDLSRVSADFGR